jgi:mono/diheme cytochrome c family protein
MATDHRNRFATWFQRVTWVGIAANLALAIPTLFAPERLMELASLPAAVPLMWVRFSALLLVLLSLFYVPAARDCTRFRVVAWLAVGARLAGVVFFSTQPRAYLLFGLFDLTFLVPEATLLFLAQRSERLTAAGTAPVNILSTRRGRLWSAIGVAVLAVATLGGAFTYVQFFREQPPPYFASDEEHFLFGSTGTEAEQGIPYWIWLVLPRIFPEYLPRPGGYAALGILGKDGHEMPVGLSKVTVGFPRVGINCAVCHTARWREQPGDPPTIVAAGPAHQTGEQEYLRFLIACASDPRFNADTILGEIAKNHRLSMLDRLLYRFAIIPFTRRGLLRERRNGEWMDTRTEWGRGRIDPFNRVKFSLLEQPVDETIGNSDMVPLWNLKQHQGMALHWDGLNANLKEVVLSSALGDGATRKWVDRDMRKWDSGDPRQMSSLRRIYNYISEVPAPKYPFAVNAVSAEQGRAIFESECAVCHAFGGGRTGTVMSVAEIGTDRHRLDMWTPASATAYNRYGDGHDWDFSAFRKTDGYVSVPLDGLWLRAPYLHNGSVPSLADLLEPPELRPKQFWRGYDVYDPAKVGFVSSGADAERAGTFFETSRPGNSNAGHLYGTDLPAASKRSLIEYLKTQ